MANDLEAPQDLDSHRDYLRFLVRSQIGPRLQGKIDPSDVVQQALLKAHEKRAQYRGKTEAELAAWLRTILANTLAQELRRFHRQQRDVQRERSLEHELAGSSDRLDAWLVAEQSSPSEHLARGEQIRRLAASLAQLPEDQRRVLELRHLGSRSVQEICAELGRSEASVAGLLRRGLKRLRELLTELS